LSRTRSRSRKLLRVLLLRVPEKQVPYTKENVVPISGEEYVRGQGFDPASSQYKEFTDPERSDLYWFFKTPFGTQRMPKKDYRATDFLDDNNKGKIVFGDEDDAESLIEATSQEGLGEWLSAIDYGRADGKSVLHFDNVDADKLDRLKRYAEIWDGKLSAVDGDAMPPKRDVSQEEALEKILAREQPDPKPRFTGGHWDESDVIAHIRFNERVDPDGNKVLFIEEIQSDWAHKGKDVGFKGPKDIAARERYDWIQNRKGEIKEELVKLGETPEGNYGLGEEGQKELDKVTAQMEEWTRRNSHISRLRRESGEYQTPSGQGISAEDLELIELLKKKPEEIKAKYDPNYAKKQELIEESALLQKEAQDLTADSRWRSGRPEPGPFVTDAHQWTNLALKRMIRWGSDEGFDSIAWVTGKQSADRYNVRKLVDQVTWNPKTEHAYCSKR
jgi:hypothetical protein